MHSRSSHPSRIKGLLSASKGSRARWRQMGVASALASLALGCGEDEGGTVALADSASLTALTNNSLQIPTTVAVRDGVAWVVESQFDQYPPFNDGVGTPGPFRILGIPLNGGAAQEIELPPDTFPEGIAVSRGGNMFVGSVARGEIYVIRAGSTEASIFLREDVLENSAIGLTVSTDSRTLWVCDTNATPPTGELPTGTVVGIGLADNEVKARHELAPSASGAGAFCNDLVMGPDGSLWITESFGGRIFRITADDLLDDNSAEVWLEDPELAGIPAAPFGANGIALLGGRIFVVNSAFGTLMNIDASLEAPDTNDINVIAITEDDAEVALANPDGITVLNDRELLIVENGLGLGDEGRRLVRAQVAR